jgi:hypothetical protein
LDPAPPKPVALAQALYPRPFASCAMSARILRRVRSSVGQRLSPDRFFTKIADILDVGEKCFNDELPLHYYFQLGSILATTLI